MILRLVTSNTHRSRPVRRGPVATQMVATFVVLQTLPTDLLGFESARRLVMTSCLTCHRSYCPAPDVPGTLDLNVNSSVRDVASVTSARWWPWCRRTTLSSRGHWVIAWPPCWDSLPMGSRLMSCYLEMTYSNYFPVYFRQCLCRHVWRLTLARHRNVVVMQTVTVDGRHFAAFDVPGLARACGFGTCWCQQDGSFAYSAFRCQAEPLLGYSRSGRYSALIHLRDCCPQTSSGVAAVVVTVRTVLVAVAVVVTVKTSLVVFWSTKRYDLNVTDSIWNTKYSTYATWLNTFFQKR